MILKHITLDLPIKTVTVHITQEKDMYLAHCPVFDVMVQGNTEEHVLGSIKNAVELFLEEFQDREELS